MGESVAQVGVTLQPPDNAVKHAVLADPHVWGGRKAGEMFVFLRRGREGLVEDFCFTFCAFAPYSTP